MISRFLQDLPDYPEVDISDQDRDQRIRDAYSYEVGERYFIGNRAANRVYTLGRNNNFRRRNCADGIVIRDMGAVEDLSQQN